MARHMSWIDEQEKELEQKVLAEYSSDEVRKHLEYLTTLTRLAGTKDELKAARYIKKKLEDYGIEAVIHEFEGYISHPGEAELEILSPVRQSFPCLAHAFIAATPPEGIEMELLYVGGGFEEDYAQREAKGKIILAGPVGKQDHVEVGVVAEQHGALAQIHINKGAPRAIDIAQLRHSWGAPTPETMDHVPHTATVSVCNEDGKYLIGLAQKGRVVARLKADAWRGYRKVRFPTGTLKGRKEPEKYVLFGAHYCSWYKGATDNAAANSLLLEIARIFGKFRKNLNRGVKFAWWAGHSQGTFAGSSWYVDTFWDDIRDNAIAYFVMDGLGRIGSSGFETRNNEEIRKFHEQVVKETLGLEVKSGKLGRGGDQSFWGAGIPSATGATTFTPEQTAAMGGKPIWYSHTIDDTLDKVDMELLKIPFRVNSTSILRLCNQEILPFDFVTVSEAFTKRLTDLQEAGGGMFDLTSLLCQAEELRTKAGSFNRLAARELAASREKGLDKKVEARFRAMNAKLMELSRILIPALSSRVGKYGQDPLRSKLKPIPTLQPLESLRAMDPGSDAYRALRTSLIRERNKLSDALDRANRLFDEALCVM